MHITVCCLFASETKTAEGYCKSAKRIQVIWARTITFIRAWQLPISMLAQQILLYLWLQILLDCWMCSNIITVSIKISDRPVASTRVQGWGDEPREPTVRLPDWSELVASYSRMKSAWGWANVGQPIVVCYIRKYVIILGIFPLTSPPQPKYWGDVSPASPARLTPVPAKHIMQAAHQ